MRWRKRSRKPQQMRLFSLRNTLNLHNSVSLNSADMKLQTITSIQGRIHVATTGTTLQRQFAATRHLAALCRTCVWPAKRLGRPRKAKGDLKFTVYVLTVHKHSWVQRRAGPKVPASARSPKGSSAADDHANSGPGGGAKLLIPKYGLDYD